MQFFFGFEIRNQFETEPIQLKAIPTVFLN